jgi:hypothetical protein
VKQRTRREGGGGWLAVHWCSTLHMPLLTCIFIVSVCMGSNKLQLTFRLFHFSPTGT